MDLKINEINRREVLNNLHYRGSIIPENIERDLEKMTALVFETAKPKGVYFEFDLGDESLEKILLGEDVKKLLATSSRVVLMAVTLGLEVERVIQKMTYKDLSKSVLLDAISSAAVESLANDLNLRIRDQVSPLFLTDRFSPGYGDLPLSTQRDFLDIIGATKAIGLTVTDSGILIPRKSITALMGVSTKRQFLKISGCKNCRLHRDCQYLKRGESCEYK